MNKAHEACGSDEWRQAIREVILPWAMGETDLGDNVLEVGPGYGATTDVLSQSVPRLTSVEIDDKLAAMLTDKATALLIAGIALLIILRHHANIRRLLAGTGVC